MAELPIQFISIRGFQLQDEFIIKEAVVVYVETTRVQHSHAVFKAPLYLSPEIICETEPGLVEKQEKELSLRWTSGTVPYECSQEWLKDNIGTDAEVPRFSHGPASCIFIRRKLGVDVHDLVTYGCPELMDEYFEPSLCVLRCSAHGVQANSWEYCAVACAQKLHSWFVRESDKFEEYIFFTRRRRRDEPIRFISINSFDMYGRTILKEVTVMCGHSKHITHVVFKPPVDVPAPLDKIDSMMIAMDEMAIGTRWYSGTKPYENVEQWLEENVKAHSSAQWFTHGPKMCMYLRENFGINACDLVKYGFPSPIKKNEFEDLETILRCSLHGLEILQSCPVHGQYRALCDPDLEYCTTGHVQKLHSMFTQKSDEISKYIFE